MTFPSVLEQIWYMNNSDINVVGEHLGYDWKTVCDAIRDARYYAEDMNGTFTISRSDNKDYSSNEIINKIMIAIFENYPKVNEININNDF